MVCRVCLENVKKSAVLCESCSLIAHAKCAINAPPTCDLRAQLLLYARYAEQGNPESAYANSVNILQGGRGHIPTSPTSEVAYVAPSPSSKMSADYPIAESSLHSGSPNRPPTAFKFMAAFKTKRARASLTPEPGQGSSSTSLLPASDIHSQSDIQERTSPQEQKEKVVRKKASVLKRNRDLKQRPQSLSSNSTSPNTSSMRSAAESMSTRMDSQGKSAVSEADGGARSRLSAAQESEFEAITGPLSGTSIVAAGDSEHLSPNIPGSMPMDIPHPKKRDSKQDKRDSNCSIQ